MASMTQCVQRSARLKRQRGLTGLARAGNCNDPHGGSALNKLHHTLHLRTFVCFHTDIILY